MSPKKKLLFLAYYFPPFPEIASVRCGSIARNLAKKGWDVKVITPHPNYLRGVTTTEIEDVAKEMARLGITMAYTKYHWRYLASHHMKCYDRGLGWYCKGVCHVIAKMCGIDGRIGWHGPALKAGKEAAGDGVDLILASGGPWCTFNLARKLAGHLSCPYVLDYRDLWTTGNPHGLPPPAGAKRDEFRTVSDCAALFTVSPSMAQNLSNEFDIAHKTHVVSNGYDPDDLTGVAKADFNHFAIVYTGVFLPPKRDVWPIMKALREIKRLRPDNQCRFHYFGPSTELVRAWADKYGVSENVDIHGVVPRAEALEAVHGAGAVVVVTSALDEGTLEDRGILTGKIFEAIGLGTPIITIAPAGSDVEEVVSKTGAGRVFSGSDTNGIVGYLCGLMNGHEPGTGHPEAYAWPNMISRMDEVLLSVVSNSRTKMI